MKLRLRCRTGPETEPTSADKTLHSVPAVGNQMQRIWGAGSPLIPPRVILAAERGKFGIAKGYRAGASRAPVTPALGPGYTERWKLRNASNPRYCR